MKRGALTLNRSRRGARPRGEALGELLKAQGVSAAQMVRAMFGRAAKRGEASDVEAGHWTYEPEEVPGLLALYRERLGEYAGQALRGRAGLERLKAQRIREADTLAQAAQRDALTLAALPRDKELEKITRYEAHLERTLYRALHELEAARREGAGQSVSPPIRGAFDGEQT